LIEGWLDENYLILFSEEEGSEAAERYQLDAALPGYTLVGLRGWDDFIVRDAIGKTYTVPTVPLDAMYLEAFELPSTLALQGDPRFAGRVKWYIKPLIFGGDPQAKDNLTWLSLPQHVELVVWWNATYRKQKGP